MKTHGLKIWPKYYSAVRDRAKKFEYRCEDDKRFDVGDHLRLFEFNHDKPEGQRLTGNEIEVVVTYILRAPDFGLAGKMCIMSIDLLDSKGKSEK